MKTKPLSDIKDDANKRHNAILEVAYNSFVQEGVRGLNIRQIAQSANIHPPVIYQLFGGKEGLVYELAKRLIDDIEEKLLYNIDTHSHPFLKMTQYGINYINIGINQPALFQFILNHDKDILSDVSVEKQKETVFDLYKIAVSKFMSYLKSFIKELYELGVIKEEYINEGSADEVIDSLTINAWASVHGLAALANNRAALETTFENFYDSFIAAFALNSIIKFQSSEELKTLELKAIEIIMSVNIKS